MNTRMIIQQCVDECCQCGNVASTNTNCQCAYAKAETDKFGIGNIGIGNTSTMATLNKLLCTAGLLMLSGCAVGKYDYEMGREPYERPSVVTDCFCEAHHVQPCFIATTISWEDSPRWGDAYMGPIGGPIYLLVLSGYFLVDTPFALCTDIVTMPWQIARYRRFTSEGNDDPQSAIVPELLRWLKREQQLDGQLYGCISGIGESHHRLANTAMTVLALLHRGDLPHCETEFSEMCEKGIEYLVSCADTSGGTIRLKGEDADPRAFFIAADTLVSAYGYTRNPNLREIGEKCAARVAAEVASVGADAVIDETIAGKLRWAVMTLQDAKGAGLSVADLNARLEHAKSILARYGKGDNGYYDVWELWRKVYVDGTADAHAWAALYAARRDAMRKCICVLGSEQDRQGTWRWMSTVRPCEGGIAKSGLGEYADVALSVLQLTWPVSNRCPPRNGANKGTDSGVSLDI